MMSLAWDLDDIAFTLGILPRLECSEGLTQLIRSL